MYDCRVNEEIPCLEKINPVCDKPLSVLMDEVNKKAVEALIMAKKINVHLFGIGNNDETCANPSCFMDALKSHDYILMMLCDELVRLAERCGV